MADSCRLNISLIDKSLRGVQKNFAEINRVLKIPRDTMTNEVRANMVSGYKLVDDFLAHDVDLFAPGNSKLMLELNQTVLCGPDPKIRKEFHIHLTMTEKRFYKTKGGGVGALVEWQKNHGSDSVWRRSAGCYINVLSVPQLFIEGNHRTGSLIMSYVLARSGRPPFVLSAENAKAYFDPSSLIKNSKRHSIDMVFRLPKLHKRLARLLKETSEPRYLLRKSKADKLEPIQKSVPF